MGLGAWVALSRRRWLAGGAIGLGALALLALEIRWVIPHFRHEPYVHLWRYAHLGQSLGEIILTIVTHPLRTVGELLAGGRLVYLAALLAPFGFLPVLGAWDLAGALPALAQNSLSTDPILYNHRTQYQAFVLPFLILAAVTGYSRLAARRGGQWPVAILVVAFMGAWCSGRRWPTSWPWPAGGPAPSTGPRTRCWRNYHRPRRSPPRTVMYRT